MGKVIILLLTVYLCIGGCEIKTYEFRFKMNGLIPQLEEKSEHKI